MYAQLGSRGRSPGFGDIERDAQRCCAEHPQLQSTLGSLVALLQAYMAMVPDVQYSTGMSHSSNFLFCSPFADGWVVLV